MLLDITFSATACDSAYLPVTRTVFPVRPFMFFVDGKRPCVHFTCGFTHKINDSCTLLYLTILRHIAIRDIDRPIRVGCFIKSFTSGKHSEIKFHTVSGKAAVLPHNKHVFKISGAPAVQRHAFCPGYIQCTATAHDYLPGRNRIVLSSLYSQGSIYGHSGVHAAACADADTFIRTNPSARLYHNGIVISSADGDVLIN